MSRVFTYSMLLLIGLILSQFLPNLFGTQLELVSTAIRVLTMTGLAFIMIHVGFEFHINKNNLGTYGWDYFVAFTAPSFPWIFVTAYFVFVMLPSPTWFDVDAWKETLLAGRFAAPTSAGVLFSMLTAAGLSATWMFKKARILAIFDDLDTVLLMIPLKMLIVGIAWQLGTVILLFTILLLVAWFFLHRIQIPITWKWVVAYSATIVAISELIYSGSKLLDSSVPIHIEVLLPAFVLGTIARPRGVSNASTSVESMFHKILESANEKRASLVISSVFMLMVGLSMPAIFAADDPQHPNPSLENLHSAAPPAAVDETKPLKSQDGEKEQATLTARQPSMSWGLIGLHVVAITILSNIGKMFPLFCYRREAHWKHRLALSIGMWPRGEVGAGILVLSLSFGIGGPIVTVAMLSLALNLLLTGAFILVVKQLVSDVHSPDPVLDPQPKRSLQIAS